MTRTTMVSIIIPAYNAEAYLQATVESALNQTYDGVKEIIIVDDGSTDNTLKVALQYENNESVKIISQSNKGASAARNTGFLASHGDYIQFLDADDVLDPNKIHEQLRIIRANANDKICAGRWGLFYDDIQYSTFDANELWRDFETPVEWLTIAWTKAIWMHPSAWLTPRHLIEKSGLWDENLSLHDDGEFFCRVLLQSKGVIFCHDAISYYRKGIPNSLSSIISEKAIRSHFRICQLYEAHLLSHENSQRTRAACAANYLSFHYTYFPDYKDLRQMAIDASGRLGGSNINPAGTGLFLFMKFFLGWKLAKRVERFCYRNGLSRTSLTKSIVNLTRM